MELVYDHRQSRCHPPASHGPARQDPHLRAATTKIRTRLSTHRENQDEQLPPQPPASAILVGEARKVSGIGSRRGRCTFPRTKEHRAMHLTIRKYRKVEGDR